MRLLPRAQLIPPVVIAVAILASLGPHLLMLGYHVVGAAPPSALLLVCPLNHVSPAHAAPPWTLHAKPLA